MCASTATSEQTTFVRYNDDIVFGTASEVRSVTFRGGYVRQSRAGTRLPALMCCVRVQRSSGNGMYVFGGGDVVCIV